MSINVQCPTCRAVTTAPDGPDGRTAHCPSCRGSFTVPYFIGRFEIHEWLGGGGFGAVYRAFDRQRQEWVALKVLKPERAVDDEIAARFRREARTANLKHDHIVKFYDAGSMGGVHYIASELIQGRTLESGIPAGGMEPRRAAELIAQLASALGYAHLKGVHHRDVKPLNIMLDERGSLRLVDFGIARWTQEESTRLTEDGTRMGTLAYMSPEQARGDTASIDGLSDLYSAGVVLYRLLTGRLPFEHSGPALLYQIINNQPPPPSAHRPGLDARLEAICLKAMAKKPQDRFGSGEAMAAALRGWILSAPAAEPTPEEVRPTPLEGTLDHERVNSFGMPFRLIQAGTYLMGSPDNEEGQSDDEKPQHEVVIARPFYLGVYQVTQEEYMRVTGKPNPSVFSETGGGKDKVVGLETSRFPVECVSWHDALAFCVALNRRDATRAAAWVYDLPTEAEWEYACRAGTRTAYSFGDAPRDLDDYAWYSGNAGPHPHPVGQKKPNLWGLYDMHGNVWEWCADWYGRDYYQSRVKSGPKGPDTGTARALRGGSWHYDAGDCRAARRDRGAPADRGSNFGFRVCIRLD